jgi:hypothetical protein
MANRSEAAKKAWMTRRKNEAARRRKRRAAAKKAWVTMRANEAQMSLDELRSL